MATKEPDSGLAAIAADHPAVGGDTGNTRHCEPADGLWRTQPPRIVASVEPDGAGAGA